MKTTKTACVSDELCCFKEEEKEEEEEEEEEKEEGQIVSLDDSRPFG